MISWLKFLRRFATVHFCDPGHCPLVTLVSFSSLFACESWLQLQSLSVLDLRLSRSKLSGKWTGQPRSTHRGMNQVVTLLQHLLNLNSHKVCWQNRAEEVRCRPGYVKVALLWLWPRRTPEEDIVQWHHMRMWIVNITMHICNALYCRDDVNMKWWQTTNVSSFLIAGFSLQEFIKCEGFEWLPKILIAPILRIICIKLFETHGIIGEWRKQVWLWSYITSSPSLSSASQLFQVHCAVVSLGDIF